MATTETVAQKLLQVLGNTYVLYGKTHSYHWNVTGARFHALHNLFEEHYRAMWESLDDIAERIRTLGVTAPLSTREMAEASSIKENDNAVPSADTMLQNLVSDHTTWLEDAEGALDEASDVGDTGTEDLLSTLIAAHEKMRWMLKSSIDD